MQHALGALPSSRSGPSGASCKHIIGMEKWEAARRQTPGTQSVVHLNNAGCSLPSQTTLDEVVRYLQLEATVGGYEAAGQTPMLGLAYSALATLLNCHPEEIAVLSSATAAWQAVVYGLAWNWGRGDRLITSVAEYGSNYIAYLQLAKRTGVEIRIVPENAQGDIDLEALESLILAGDRRPRLISITHVPTSSGRVYDAAGVGRLARKHSVLFLLDACQSVGQMPVDVRAIGCDFASGTGRKYLRAPRGSGFLYCSREALGAFEPASVDNTGATWGPEPDHYTLQPTAKRFEQYEMSFASKLGLGIAVEHCLALGQDAIWERIQALAALMRSGLARLEGVQVQDVGATLCGIVSFTKAGVGCERVQQELLAQGINVSVSLAGSTLLDFKRRQLKDVVRASVHYYNSQTEIDSFLAALEGVT